MNRKSFLKKKIGFIIYLISMGVLLKGQSTTNTSPISVGYYGQNFIQPGIKIGTSFDLKRFDADTANPSSLFLSPQLGVFTQPNQQTSGLVNLDFGYKKYKEKNGKMRYNALSVGLAYGQESQIISQTVHLSDGQKEKTRVNKSFLMPMLNYEFGRFINPQLGWYSKFSAGSMWKQDAGNALVGAIEFGLHIQL